MYKDLPLFSKLMARKVIVSKFKFFIMKLWEFARLFTATACVNLIFPPQKLNSNEALQLDTRGFNAAFSLWIPPVSVVQFIIQMFKLNGLGKTRRERLCSRTENFARPFITEKLFERIQILNEWNFHRLIQLQTDISLFKFPGTFCEGLKLIINAF